MLADRGIAAFVVDYYFPRGLTEETDYMLATAAVTEFDLVADAYGALRLLSMHPDIDPERIGVAGFSYGGVAARLALDDRIRRALAPESPGFALHVDYYGPCHMSLRTERTTGAPLLTLRGSEDASNDLEACARHEAELQAAGSEVEAHIYPGAGHSWDSRRPRKLRAEAPYLRGCEIVYDASGRAWVEDEILIDMARGTPRETRFSARLVTLGPLEECIRYGYVMGWDEATKARSDAHLLAFLDRVFGSRNESAR
jgi:dienelactone hydrolase